MKLEECINYLLTGAQHKVFLEMKNGLKELDLTPIQYAVLQCIWQYDMSSPTEIADFLGVENSTISGILDRMEGKGFLIREIDQEDRHHIMIRLTDQANALEDNVNRIVEQVNKSVLCDFDENEAETLKDYLKRIMR